MPSYFVDTALARHAGAVFVLRIEDTGGRSTGESERAIVEDLRGTGLDWSEGRPLQAIG
jgi:glutamyl/glutaminyl-tRNA synthetase